MLIPFDVVSVWITLCATSLVAFEVVDAFASPIDANPKAHLQEIDQKRVWFDEYTPFIP